MTATLLGPRPGTHDPRGPYDGQQAYGSGHLPSPHSPIGGHGSHDVHHLHHSHQVSPKRKRRAA
jgi:hypothetical protein